MLGASSVRSLSCISFSYSLPFLLKKLKNDEPGSFMLENKGISYNNKDRYIESAPAMNVPNAPSIEKMSLAKDAPKVPGESQIGYIMA